MNSDAIALRVILTFTIGFVSLSHANNLCAQSQQPNIPALGQKLTDDQAASLAQLAIAGLQREFPNKPANVITSPETILGPKQMHPAFYGCYDWHSSVHGHWMLIRLLKTNPNHPLAAESRKRLNENLTEGNIQAEAIYFDEKENKSFERMYGWAWLLRLAGELHVWDDPMGQTWRKAILPLEAKIVELTKGYLPRLKQPIRTGVHPDTAFALGQILDYARIVSERELEDLIVARAREYYGNDAQYNSDYEPSGEDFFSQSLNEADLMRRILPTQEFGDWLSRFLPDLSTRKKSRLLEPVEVSDVTDGKLVHLAGLDLSRAWCMQGIARSLPKGDSRVALLDTTAKEHARIGLGYVFSGHYEGEHWLGTFAVYALTPSFF
jgi:hypothetical protein